jgi:exodeoxyribonuclease VII large subunit
MALIGQQIGARPLFSPLPADAPVYTVSRLNREAKTLLEGGFPPLWIEGEISGLSRPASGHLYFNLKDERAVVRCALFRGQQRAIATVPAEGMHVLARATVSLYEGRGDFQLIVEYLEEAGEGALRRAFEALKRRLGEEGLFDAARKKALPRLPRRIGLVTSPSGAVLHDILTTLKRRFPAIAVRLYPVPVQGEGAADKIAAMIRRAGDERACDALIVARGGGSLEDLWAFNEEAVVRAVAACPIPLVAGVGHETDITLTDLAADARAPTPTAAAEMLSPDQNEWLTAFAATERRLVRIVHSQLSAATQRLDALGARLTHPRSRLTRLDERLQALNGRLRLLVRARHQRSAARLVAVGARLQQHNPAHRLGELGLKLTHRHERLCRDIGRGLAARRERLARLVHVLDSLSPLATLARGYAIVQRSHDGHILRDATEVKPGERVRARLARGRLGCVVEEIERDDG